MLRVILDLSSVIDAIRKRISSLEKERDEKINGIRAKYDPLIKRYEEALEVNMELNQACLRCQGRGHYRGLDPVGHSETVLCQECKGSGLASKEN